MQFDGTDDRIYETLRGEPLLEIKKKAIENCRKAGIPVTIVPTVVKDVNLDNLGLIVEFLLENIDVIKGVHFQPVSFFGRYPDKQKHIKGQNKQNKSDSSIRHIDYKNRVTMFDVMHELEKQTSAKLHFEDFYPLTSGHTLCCFSSSYQKLRNGSIRSLINYRTKTSGQCCHDLIDPLEVIRKDRDFVVNKWVVSNELQNSSSSNTEATSCNYGAIEPAAVCSSVNSLNNCCESEPMDFDSFLWEIKNSMFTVSCMAFMDNSNLDADRLKRCRVQVLSPDNRLIPFCAYNSIYRY